MKIILLLLTTLSVLSLELPSHAKSAGNNCVVNGQSGSFQCNLPDQPPWEEPSAEPQKRVSENKVIVGNKAGFDSSLKGYGIGTRILYYLELVHKDLYTTYNYLGQQANDDCFECLPYLPSISEEEKIGWTNYAEIEASAEIDIKGIEIGLGAKISETINVEKATSFSPEVQYKLDCCSRSTAFLERKHSDWTYNYAYQTFATVYSGPPIPPSTNPGTIMPTTRNVWIDSGIQTYTAKVQLPGVRLETVQGDCVEVPGPIPLLGLGAFVRFSRKIRNLRRIQLSITKDA
jgi:hypothetical protein